MLPRDTWGEFATAAPIDPLDLEGDLERWSGVATAGELGVVFGTET